MAGGKLLFRTIVSRSIEIRLVVGSGVLSLCGFSLWRLSRAVTSRAQLHFAQHRLSGGVCYSFFCVR